MQELPLVVNSSISHNFSLVTWLVSVFMLALGVFLQKTWIKEYIVGWNLNKTLKNIGIESLHNVSIADELGEKIFIEHLVLTQDKIVLLGVKKIRGLIFAAKKIDLWTQVVGNKSYKFENPLHQLENNAVILNSKIENAQVVGKVLFINGSEFPKGKPDDVVAISDIKSWSLEHNNLKISKKLREDWNQLKTLVVSNDLDEDILIEKNQFTGINVFSLVITLVIISLWLVWRL